MVVVVGNGCRLAPGSEKKQITKNQHFIRKVTLNSFEYVVPTFSILCFIYVFGDARLAPRNYQCTSFLNYFKDSKPN